MGIMSALTQDIKELVEYGYDDEYIARAVDMDLNVIEYFVNYFRKEIEKSKPKETLNNR